MGPYSNMTGVFSRGRAARSVHTQERLREDTERRQPSARLGERPQENPNLPYCGLGLRVCRAVRNKYLLLSHSVCGVPLWQP